MSFQKSRLVSNISVANRMRFVERVRCKCLPVSPNLINQRVDLLPHLLASLHELLVFITPLDELRLQLVHRVNLFLTHCLTKSIRHTPGKITQCAGL